MIGPHRDHECRPTRDRAGLLAEKGPFRWSQGPAVPYRTSRIRTSPHTKSYRLLTAEGKRYPRADLRRLPTGIYNCHGMTFAARRTQIPDPEVVPAILEDDGYARVSPGSVREGDVAVYYDGREVAHTGVVLQVEADERLLGHGRAARVMSKWGSAGEYVHYAHESPYAGVAGMTVTYWTDRDEFRLEAIRATAIR